MTSHFFAGKHSAQFTKPTLGKCTHKHRSASEYACMFAMGELHDQTHLSNLKYYLHPWRVARLIIATDMLLTYSVSSYLACFVFFLGFSLFPCASIIIFLNRRVLRSEILRCLKKGKGASPSASKTLVRPKYHQSFIV